MVQSHVTLQKVHQVVLEATVGGEAGDIAVDDISFVSGPCPASGNKAEAGEDHHLLRVISLSPHMIQCAAVLQVTVWTKISWKNSESGHILRNLYILLLKITVQEILFSFPSLCVQSCDIERP